MKHQLAAPHFLFFFFFFSSRRRHTRCLSDWSSDVCSSDLNGYSTRNAARTGTATHAGMPFNRAYSKPAALSAVHPASRAARKSPSDWVIGLILALGCVAAGARAQEAPPSLARRIAHRESETQAARNDYRYCFMGLSLALGCVAAGARAQEAPPSLARRIAHRESETQAARNDYTYRQTVVFAELDAHGAQTGEYREERDVIFSPEHERTERVIGK